MSTVDIITNLASLLPTGTFLTFQVVAPLATNNGNCGVTERILTSISIAILTLGCFLTTFTDSHTAPNGKVYIGFVTYSGLLVLGYNRSEIVAIDEEFQDGGKYINKDIYKPHLNDYINAVLSVVSFLTLTLFTDPVSTCFYPNISTSLLKTLPVLVATVVSFFCSFSPKVRHGIGLSLPRAQTSEPSKQPARTKA